MQVYWNKREKKKTEKKKTTIKWRPIACKLINELCTYMTKINENIYIYFFKVC